MSLSTRLLLPLVLAAWAGLGQAATTTTTKSTSKSKSSGTASASKSKSSSTASKAKEQSPAKAKADSDADADAKPDTPAEKNAEKAVPKEDTPKPPRPAAVSTVSIEQISGFDRYPKQVQSLVQSALALTHLELRYQYGSSEPNNGGMDCSGTIYHVLRFQGLKDVPRQSDEMAMWVDKKSQLHLTPTATDFDSPEFKDLKPGDLLFWTNTMTTTRKLPVTHVMIYLGKLKGSGRRIVFGASDGRSFDGQRRSGVSVFDFHLPRAEGTARLHGYGAAPGLLPQEEAPALASSKPATPGPRSAASATAAAMTSKPEQPAKKDTPKEPEAAAAPKPMYTKVSPPPAQAAALKHEPRKEETTAAASPPKLESKPAPAAGSEGGSSSVAATAAAPDPPKEEVRKAVAVNVDEAQETTAAVSADTANNTSAAAAAAGDDAGASSKLEKAKAGEPAPKTVSKPKSSSSSSTASKAKSRTTAPKKRTSSVSTRRRAPPPPQKSSVERALDNAVNSVRRIFR